MKGISFFGVRNLVFIQKAPDLRNGCEAFGAFHFQVGVRNGYNASTRFGYYDFCKRFEIGNAGHQGGLQCTLFLYVQGGLTYEHVKLAVTAAVKDTFFAE